MIGVLPRDIESDALQWQDETTHSLSMTVHQCDLTRLVKGSDALSSRLQCRHKLWFDAAAGCSDIRSRDFEAGDNHTGDTPSVVRDCLVAVQPHVIDDAVDDSRRSERLSVGTANTFEQRRSAFQRCQRIRTF